MGSGREPVGLREGQRVSNKGKSDEGRNERETCPLEDFKRFWNGPSKPCFQCVGPLLGVSSRHPNILWEVFLPPVNLRESAGNWIRRMQIFLDRRGEGLVEFALVLPMALLLIFAVIDLGRYYFVRETLEHAVRQAGRYAVTGQSSPPTNRVNSIKAVAVNAAAGLDTTAINISSSAVGSGNWSNNWAGGPGDNVKISLTTTIGFFTPGIGRYFGATQSNTFTVSVTFRNENFPASEEN